MFAFLLSPLGKALAALLAAAALLAGVYALGRHSGSTEAEREALKSETETRERVDEALACDPDVHWTIRLRECP